MATDDAAVEVKPRTIFDLANLCEDKFSKYADPNVPLPEPKGRADLQQQRFEGWASYLGVFAHYDVSLDRRLEYSEEIRSLVLQLLSLIRKNLDFILISSHQETLLDNGKHKAKEVDVQPKLVGTASEALDAIEATIDRLNRLSSTIRKYSISSLENRVNAFTARYGDQNYATLAKLIVHFRYRTAPASLQEHLATSMSARRQRLRYVARHQTNLASRQQRTRRDQQDLLDNTTVLSQSLEEIKEEEEFDNTTQPGLLPNFRRRLPRSSLNNPFINIFTTSEMGSKASTFKPTPSVVARLQRGNGASVVSSSKNSKTFMAEDLENYPEAPKKETGKPAPPCPFCFKPLEDGELKKGHWQRHVNTDLQPYVCISEKCSQPPQTFADVEIWAKHMRDSHSSKWTQQIHKPVIWRCDLYHDEEVFAEEEGFEEHLTQKHATSSAAERRAISRSSKSVRRRRSNICPLCGYDVSITDSTDSAPVQKLASEPKSANDEEDELLHKLAKHIASHLRLLCFTSVENLDTWSDDSSTRSFKSLDIGSQDESESLALSGRTDMSTAQLSFETFGDHVNLTDPDPMTEVALASHCAAMRIESDTQENESDGWSSLDDYRFVVEQWLSAQRSLDDSATVAIDSHVLYRAFTITRKKTWRRDDGLVDNMQITIIRLTHDEVLEKVTALSSNTWESVEETVAKLHQNQQKRISEFMRRLVVREANQSFEWSLVQLETKGNHAHAPLALYVKRHPREESRSSALPFHPSKLPQREGYSESFRQHPARSRSLVSESQLQSEPEAETEPEAVQELEAAVLDKSQCDQCENYYEVCFYCYLCDMAYCPTCWDQVRVHLSGRVGPGGIPHEKTDQKLARKLRAALEAEPTDQEQDKLFREDQDTTWFGVIKDETGTPTLRDYGRYAEVIDGMRKNQGPQPDRHFPRLVSFLGQTGAGKSTLIKLLIQLNEKGKPTHQTPVVGSIRHQHIPTSGEVHLYVDPVSFLSKGPILYADCEGFDGGEREPIGAMKHQRTNSTSETPMPYMVERDVLWANTPEQRSREYAVKQLYPRFLYPFSDVVVYVLKNPRFIDHVIESLLDWASTALEMSSSQPVLPHAILVLNASELAIDAEQWDPLHTTEWMMSAVKDSISMNVKCKQHAQLWRSRGKSIETVQDILLSYYASVKVVRIPHVGRPNLMQTQFEKLYREIAVASDNSEKRKKELRMLVNARDLQSYFEFAFDHFSHTLDQAFDFVQASYANDSISPDFGKNILRLAVTIMEACGDKLNGKQIFDELSFMVASCIMLDSTRTKLRGLANMIFPEYVGHCDNALEDFCDRYWPCEFIRNTGSGRPDSTVKCVNKRSGHSSKGHQSKNGKIIAPGNYQSGFTVESYGETFRYLIFEALEKLLAKLRTRIMTSPSDSEDEIAAILHRETVMVPFYKHTDDIREKSLVSPSTCFSCLMSLPQHVLPCGHIICTPCVVAYGTQRNPDAIEINSCPMHVDTTSSSWKVYLKPDTAGARVLSLDGGGVRVIAALEILRLIEQTWGNELRIQDFFDLIVGTGTGGLVALGLVSMDWSVEQCIREFHQICYKSFAQRLRTNIPGYNFAMGTIQQSKYASSLHEKALQEAFTSGVPLFGGWRHPRINVGVTTSASGSLSLLTNYNRARVENLWYDFQRPENAATELKIWEAARAACASPTIFKPYLHEPTGQVYLDGSLHQINPAKIADMERKLLWPNESERVPDFLLSIGNAYSRKSRMTSGEKSSITGGLFGKSKALRGINAAMDRIGWVLDAEWSWKDFMEGLALPKSEQERYQRINPGIMEDLPALDDIKQMESLQGAIRIQMAGDVAITRAAYRLLATTFYFEKTVPLSRLSDGSFLFKGMIGCRLQKSAMSGFGLVLHNIAEKSSDGGLRFLVRDRSRPQNQQTILLPSNTISDLMHKAQWRMGLIEIKMSSLVAVTEFVLVLREGEELPISGFPRKLHDDESPSSSSPASGGNKQRRDRSENTRKKWTPAADLPAGLRRMKSLSEFGSTDYKVGTETAYM